MALVVTIVQGERRGEELRFDALSVSVGRADHCSLMLPDRGISRHHCELSVHDGELWVQDQGTTNGTQLNGQNVHRSRVANGSEIAIGPVRFRVLLEGAAGIIYKELADYRGLIIGVTGGTPHKVPIPHPSLRSGNRWVEPGIEPKLKMLRIAAASLATLFLLLFALIQLGLVAEPTADLGNGIPELRLEPNQTFQGSIGFSARNAMTLASDKGAMLIFDHAPGLALLSMDLASIDTPRELELRLNNKPLMFAPRSKQWLVGGISMLLPEALLIPSGNRLELLHRDEKGAGRSWGVRLIRLRHFPALPVDLGVARQRFKVAEGRYRSRRAHPKNLPAAGRLFRQAALLSFNAEPQPDSYHDARQRFATAHQELTVEFRRSFLDAQRASQLEGRISACRVLDSTLRRFTDPEDWRYQRAAETRRKVCSKGPR
jgi:hypothetical protein